jgi:hypothetical protein
MLLFTLHVAVLSGDGKNLSPQLTLLEVDSMVVTAGFTAFHRDVQVVVPVQIPPAAPMIPGPGRPVVPPVPVVVVGQVQSSVMLHSIELERSSTSRTSTS